MPKSPGTTPLLVKQLPEPNWFPMWLLFAASSWQSLQLWPILCHFLNEFNENSKVKLNNMLHLLFYFRSTSKVFYQVKQLPEPNWFPMWLPLAASLWQYLQFCPLLCHFLNEFNKNPKVKSNNMLHLFYFRSTSNVFYQVKQLPEPNWFPMWLPLAASLWQYLQFCPLLCHFLNEFNKNPKVKSNNMLHLFYFRSTSNVFYQVKQLPEPNWFPMWLRLAASSWQSLQSSLEQSPNPLVTLESINEFNI